MLKTRVVVSLAISSGDPRPVFGRAAGTGGRAHRRVQRTEAAAVGGPSRSWQRRQRSVHRLVRLRVGSLNLSYSPVTRTPIGALGATVGVASSPRVAAQVVAPQ